MAPARMKRGVVLLFTLSIIAQYSQAFTPTAARIKTAKIRHTLTNNCRAIIIPNERHPSSDSDNDNVLHVSSSSITEQNHNNLNTVDPEDHKTNKEIKRLLRITSKIIGPSPNAPSIGELPSTTIRKIPLIMRAWMIFFATFKCGSCCGTFVGTTD